MSSVTEVPDVAAAYIDFVTNADAARVMLETGNLPSVVPDGWEPSPGVQSDVIAAWNTMNEKSSLVPYLDYTTTTFYDSITSGIQELLAARSTPVAFAASLQDDVDAFHADR